MVPRREKAAVLVLMAVSLAVGLYVSWLIGYYPTLNYCPNSELACAAPNIRNVIPALGGAAAAVPILIVGVFTLRRATNNYPDSSM